MRNESHRTRERENGVLLEDGDRSDNSGFIQILRERKIKGIKPHMANTGNLSKY